jgi:NTP pyrophosphatase (non-canonical NTP hydrolase)
MDSNSSDDATTIQDLRVLVDKFVSQRNWKSYHTPKNLAEAISIEAAELLENFLFQPEDYLPEQLESITDEMADVFIYLMSLVNTLNLKSFSQTVYNKMEKNKLKYPIEKYSGTNYQKQ